MRHAFIPFSSQRWRGSFVLGYGIGQMWYNNLQFLLAFSSTKRGERFFSPLWSIQRTTLAPLRKHSSSHSKVQSSHFLRQRKLIMYLVSQNFKTGRASLNTWSSPFWSQNILPRILQFLQHFLSYYTHLSILAFLKTAWYIPQARVTCCGLRAFYMMHCYLLYNSTRLRLKALTCPELLSCNDTSAATLRT